MKKMNTSKSDAKWVYLNGNQNDLTIQHVIEITENLYAKGVAEAWFIGMEWVEGFNYCQDRVYLEKTAAPSLLKNHWRALWFACRFL